MSESAKDRDVPELKYLAVVLGDVIRTQPQVSRILLLNYGFFLYPVKEEWCEKVFAPHVPGVPHAAVLVIPQNAVVGQPPPGLEPHPDALVYTVSLAGGCNVHFENAANKASLVRRATSGNLDQTDFDYVPDFVTWCKGVKLDPSALASAAKVDASVRMGGGLLAAGRDAFTAKLKWRWDNVLHRVTALTAHLTDPDPGALLITCPTTTIRVPLNSQRVIPLLLLNTPTGTPSTQAVNLSHVTSMLQLCSATEDPFEILKTYPISESSAIIDPEVQVEGLAALQKYLELTVEPRLNGEPQCSGQQIPGP